ncbi:glutamine amidotransferase [Bartonella raoultii]|uniref:Glutamine amidotransferase n=1 Tax=Bartonella raoultii TaxID=1457020 RepID=A0ABS7I697_9HYPH|nr:glutamine amidotransferase [Bartonella raoultii]MBX4335950.1 glutamine amidotransferase [Bartonella raoultii]
MFLIQKCTDKKQKNNKPKIAIVMHRRTSTYTGRLGKFLQENGFDLDIYRPILGQNLPSTLEQYAGVVMLGGSMSVNDKEDYISKEIDWISLSLKEDKPFLGICLGAQMLARNLGGSVGTKSDGTVEVGWYPLQATPQGKILMNWPEMVYQFHDEGIFDLPKEAVLLATGNTYPTQAFRYGKNAWGLQFHAEFTRAMIQRLVVGSAHKLTEKGAQPAAAHFKGRLIYDQALSKWFEEALQQIFGVSDALV